MKKKENVAAFSFSDEKFAVHFAEVDECLRKFESDEEKGLSAKQVTELQAKYGPNELKHEEKTPIWKLILEQFDDLLVKILLGAALISFVLAFWEEKGHEEGLAAFVEPFVIVLILILNASVGVWQESNAENALEALKQLQPKNAKCIRDGHFNASLPAQDLVPGDIVEVSVGDKIPADLRVVRLLTTTLRIDESALTGESMTVLKQTQALERSHDALPVSRKLNQLFSGTTVSGGRARCLVVGTGMTTEIGKIQEAVGQAAAEEDRTPLKKKLDEFGELLSKVIGVICVLVWVMNWRQFFDPVHGSVLKGCIYYMKIAVALGVAAIPEGLPAVITLCLALGTRRMVKKNAIVRKLPSVETLGCCTVICSDKTGTLTMNEMTVVSLVYAGSKADDLKEHKVEGHSYNPAGRVVDIEPLESKRDGALIDVARVCTLCNDAKIENQGGKFVRVGEPTEAALKVLAEKLGLPDGERPESKDTTRAVSDFFGARHKKLATLEFSRGRKSMSVICSGGEAGNVLFCKGAPETLITRCSHVRLRNGKTVKLTEANRNAILQKVDELAERPLRTLGFAIRENLGSLANYDGREEHPAHKQLAVADPDDFKNIENDMVFVGLCGIKDPARPEVKSSIARCKEAGIRVIMITGDKKETADAIAREIGIFSADEDIEMKSFTGQDFFKKSDKEKIRILMEGGGGRVFSRTDPKDKQALVNILKGQSEVPAMTGDGVNDAPALKAASIGIAMGIAGTEVAKEASDMVLADDNFATIVSAVEEGRAIYSNMKAFIRYLISSNIGEVASIFLTAVLGMPEGMVPVQLLWVNLVTDGPPATALGFNPPEQDIMQKPPRRGDDQLITGWVFFRYLVIGVYVGVATVGVFAYWYLYYDWAGDGHTLITWHQLTHWGQCSTWTNFHPASFDGVDLSKNACLYFSEGKMKASTLSLSVLVTIEMFNALNALSEDGSLVQMPPWSNPWLLLAIFCSFSVHCVILYVPAFASLFSLVPLTKNDWILVFAWSVPVTAIDEVLKMIGRLKNRRRLAALHSKHD